MSERNQSGHVFMQREGELLMVEIQAPLGKAPAGSLSRTSWLSGGPVRGQG